MKIRRKFQHGWLQEDLNFLLTNRIPRLTLTRFMGWWSKLEHPWLVKGSIAVWRWFSDLDLSESKQQTFASLHACFTRELKPGLRPINSDPSVLSSPCDAIIGACGEIREGVVFLSLIHI
jgi:phosphatidylserine decarboxylase